MKNEFNNGKDEEYSEKIYFYYKTSFGDVGKVIGKKSDKIQKIKEKILNSSDLKNCQYLYFNGNRLDDDELVESYEFNNQCVLDVIGELKGGMQIFVKNVEGQKYTLEVCLDENFSNIKMKIFEKSGISPKKLKLVYQGSVPNDAMTLKEANVVDQCMINMVVMPCDDINVTVKLEKKKVNIAVHKSDKVIDVKEKINELFSITVADQTLLFANAILEDHKTLGSYNINDKDHIDLVFNSSTNWLIYVFLGLLVLFIGFEIYKRSQ